MGEDEVRICCENCAHRYFDTVYGFWRCDKPPMDEYLSVDLDEGCENFIPNTED